jgi:hypothetical protein
MALLIQGAVPQPYGAGPRKVTLPVKATSQIWESSIVAQIAGACCPITTAGAGDAVGVAEFDMLGGAADGTKRISVLTDGIFIFKNGVAAFSDATPFGALAFAEDDNSVGTGALGTAAGVVGRFVGFEDDGRVRVFISESGSQESYGCQTQQVAGTNIPNAASTTVQRVGRVSRYLVPTIGQATTVTIGTTGAVKGDLFRLVRTDTSAFTLALVNGGAGAGTLATLIASKVGFIEAWFDGTNWLYDGSAQT